MRFLMYFIVAAAAYFIGSFSPSIFLSKHFLGGDVRREGSGNAGATNMARVFGMGMGVVTLLGDMLKALFAVWLGWKLLGQWGIFVSGAACLTGHCFPVLHHFKGGKGVSVGAALALAIDWRVLAIIAAVFLLGALISRKVSVGSVLAALSIVGAAIYVGADLPCLLLSIFGMVLVTLRHHENIVRVFKGTEPDFKAGRARRLRFGKKASDKAEKR